MADIKISELEPTTDLEGLYTIGSDKNNLSKKVSLQFLKDAANYANEQGDYAKQAGDTVNGNVGVSDYPEFSASKSYVIGDIVRYNGVLYAFTANHAASAWNGSDVKATSINAITSGKLTELESKTDIIEQSIYDFAISDDDGNDILTIKDGEIKTKNFDSKETTCTKDSNEVGGLSICDEMDNDIVTFDNGGIKTKNFDSKLLKDMTPFSIIYQNQSCPFGVDHEKYFVRSAKAIYAKNYIPLIIVAGQSNADGRIPYTEAPSWLVSEDYKVRGYKVWDGTSFKDYNVKGMTGARDKNTYSFDAVFAKKFLEYTGFENLYMIRQTIGGIGMESQPISDSAIAANVNWTWQPDTTIIDPKCQSMCLALQDKVYQAMSYATMVGKRLLPIAILWHQGENEADTNNVDKCENNLSNLICFIRGLFGSPTLPFINAFINGNHSESYANINKIFVAMTEMDPYMSTINMDGHYNMLQDGYDAHYNAEEINYMGEQMLENLKKYL